MLKAIKSKITKVTAKKLIGQNDKIIPFQPKVKKAVNPPLKYRAFAKVGWVYWYPLKGPCPSPEYKWEGMYIGKKDTHGTEIYAGDIVSVVVPTPKGNYNKILSEVKYSYILSCFVPLFESWDDITVIGNIFQNPELREVARQ